MAAPVTPTTLRDHSEGQRLADRVLLAVIIAAAGVDLLAVPINLAAQTDSGILEVASIGAGAALVRLARRRSRDLQIAILAQAADMLTFVFAWRGGLGERNPLSGWLLDGAYTLLPTAGTFPTATVGVALLCAKVGLLAYVVAVAAHLGRYRIAVLWLCAVAGGLGAISNILALWPAAYVTLAR